MRSPPFALILTSEPLGVNSPILAMIPFEIEMSLGLPGFESSSALLIRSDWLVTLDPEPLAHDSSKKFSGLVIG